MKSPKNAKSVSGLRKNSRVFLCFFLFAFLSIYFASCVSSASKAEEYYALGAAYFELQKYDQAETWFNKSKNHQTTKTASEYNLGRIAYETGRYDDASLYFERIIKRDKENVTALRALAYTCIKMDKLDKAEEYYRQILELVPESYDEGYNYALVLMALGRPEEAEQALKDHTDVSVANNNTERPQAILLLARVQKEQKKPEAADTYVKSLEIDDNPIIRAEYAAYLAKMGHKEKALEEYNKALENEKTTDAKKEEIRRSIARVESGEEEPEEGSENAPGSEADAEGESENASGSEADAEGGSEVQENAQ